jgi:hypothetical protein
LDEDGALTDGDLGLGTNADQSWLNLPDVGAMSITAKLLERRPALPILGNVLTLIEAYWTALGRLFRLPVLDAAGAANVGRHA